MPVKLANHLTVLFLVFPYIISQNKNWRKCAASQLTPMWISGDYHLLSVNCVSFSGQECHNPLKCAYLLLNRRRKERWSLLDVVNTVANFAEMVEGQLVLFFWMRSQMLTYRCILAASFEFKRQQQGRHMYTADMGKTLSDCRWQLHCVGCTVYS